MSGLGQGKWWAGVLGLTLLLSCHGSEQLQPPPSTDDGIGEGNEPPPTEPPGEPPPGEGEEPPPVGEEVPDSGTPVDPPPVEPDAGTNGPVGGEPIPPDSASWRFWGTAEGGPREVLGVTQDEGGNIWVAGGEDGLCLLRPGATALRCYTMADGLKPWAPWKGKDPAPEARYLKVLSVTGGPAGTVFVGYEGRPNCESEFYKAPGVFEDPAIYKSGDADRVELQADGTLRVVHYDLHSPAHSVPGYGHREKLCSVNRIVWDKARNSLWFASNHGLAWGEPDYQGGEACTNAEVVAANAWVYMGAENRQRCKFGVMEHVHPAIAMGDGTSEDSRLAGDVWGVAVRPDGDVWLATHIRTTRFKIMTNAVGHAGTGAPWNFEMARKQSEEKKHVANRIDLWPDAVAEPQFPTHAQRKDDLVSDLVLMPDGTVWVSSFAWGLAKLSDAGLVTGYLLEGDGDRNISSLELDPRDGSLWIGHRWGKGLRRMHGEGEFVSHNPALGGLSALPVWDIQMVGSGDARKVLVAFSAQRDAAGAIVRPGAIGIYSGK
ncbi:hypothetical protein BHS06_32095 [Myxococcus xanthus]|uniref:hypothetical protein n=1 Tax=Myxococcus xanthus TaxID=34 RepID=UPI00112A1F8C|nr:hypothetical protein [Myxococcus xanthus]QDE93256.1 hypothetical protein BHS06_32095 [Myxococcus xanthus]